MNENKIHTRALPDYSVYKKDKENDAALIVDLHRLFDEADILIAHNGDRFDTRKVAARFIKHGLKPPSPCRTIDTLRAARKYFLFDSNKLNDLGQYLGVGKKIPHTGFDLWKRVMTGDPAAWDVMRQYNKQDVRLLEAVYHRMRPYIANHPPLSAFTGDIRCPACQSSRLNSRGFAVSRKRKYRRLQCADCGHWHQGELISERAAG